MTTTIPHLGTFDLDRVYARDRSGIAAEVYTSSPGNKGMIAPHAHAEYQITLSPDTEGNYRYRGGSHRVPRGSVSFIHPGESHSCGGNGPRPDISTWKVLLFPADTMQALMGHLPFLKDFIQIDPALYQHFDQWFNCLWADCPHQDEALLEAFETLRGFTPYQPRPTAVRWRLEKARSYLDDVTTTRPDSDEIAAVAGLGKFHFIRTFQETYGLTPQRYLLTRRVDRAKHLIRTSQKPLSTIALECGFSDQSHLTRSFRKIVGIPPSRYLTS